MSSDKKNIVLIVSILGTFLSAISLRMNFQETVRVYSKWSGGDTIIGTGILEFSSIVWFAYFALGIIAILKSNKRLLSSILVASIILIVLWKVSEILGIGIHDSQKALSQSLRGIAIDGFILADFLLMAVIYKVGNWDDIEFNWTIRKSNDR